MGMGRERRGEQGRNQAFLFSKVQSIQEEQFPLALGPPHKTLQARFPVLRWSRLLPKVTASQRESWHQLTAVNHVAQLNGDRCWQRGSQRPLIAQNPDLSPSCSHLLHLYRVSTLPTPFNIGSSSKAEDSFLHCPPAAGGNTQYVQVADGSLHSEVRYLHFWDRLLSYAQEVDGIQELEAETGIWRRVRLNHCQGATEKPKKKKKKVWG